MRKFTFIVAALFCAAVRVTATVLPAEKLLPDDTLVMFTIPDFQKVREIYQSSPHGQLWNDPAMKDFKDKLMGKFMSEYVTPLEHEMGVHFDDYTNLPQGQFTFAMIQSGWQAKEGQTPALLFLLDTKDKSAQLKTNLADLKKKWVDAGKVVKTEKIRDVDFSVIMPSDKDMPKSLKSKPSTGDTNVPEPAEDSDAKKEPKAQIYIGQAESLLIVGNSPKAIEKILVRLSGGTVSTLAELPAFDASSAMFHDAPAFGWINTRVLVDIFTHLPQAADEANSQSPLGFQPDKIITALGLNGLNTVAFDYLYSSDGAQFNLSLAAPESTRSGIFKIMAGEPKDSKPPPFVPADAVKFSRWRLDGQKTWTSLRKILNDVNPRAVGVLDFALSSAEASAKEKDPAFDINKNLIGNLGDDLISYEKIPRSASSGEFKPAPSIVLIGSPNGDQLAASLKNILVLYNSQASEIKDHEFLGHKIYTLPLPSPPGIDGSNAPERALSYASAGGYVAITTDTSLIEEYLRSAENPGKSLRDAPGLGDAFQKVGGSGTSLLGYANESERMRVMLDAWKKDPSSANPLASFGQLAMLMGMNDPQTKEWFDVSLLPDFDKISKYFYFTVYGAGADADNITFRIFSPTPPQMKK